MEVLLVPRVTRLQASLGLGLAAVLAWLPNARAQDPAAGAGAVAPVGIFHGHQDVGTVLHPGSVEFDGAKKSYTVAGSGENMWAAADALQFAWTKADGDLTLTADVSFLGAGTDPHRKACLLIRQSLDADSAYVDVALHGEGLTSLQFRDAKGARTHEVQANIKSPKRLRLEKRGKYALMYLAAEVGQDLSFSGAATRIAIDGPFYVGIGVCAHNKDLVERAVFSKVELNTNPPAPTGKPTLYSTLETQTISSTDRRVTFVTNTRIEAPNWLHDGQTLIYNSGGRIYRVPVAGGTPEAIDTGPATRCNNDHGVSPDGTMLAISDQSQTRDGRRPSLIYTLPVAGGTPKLITPTGPSYWHGWSPDGKMLAFCGERNGEFDIYTIPADGGAETRLTTAKGLDEGPEFSPDGKSIYFNSDRTGTMQIWRMNAADGSEQAAVTNDEYNNWFPHLSPDGRRMVFLSYDKDVKDHPENKDVTLRMMTLADRKVDDLGKMFGGQGTINVPCWSPDGRRIAFVTYQLIP
jgi:Tol biopolymer transport system component